MDIRLRAALTTAKVLAFSCGIVATVVFVLHNIKMEWIPYLFIGFLTVVLVLFMYNIVLQDLKYQEKVKEMVDKR